MIIIKKYLLLLILLLMGWSLPSFATPPARWVELPDPVTAYITFPAGRGPDRDGNFEIEIYCKSRFDIESLEML